MFVSLSGLLSVCQSGAPGTQRSIVCLSVRCPEDSDFSRQMEEAMSLGAENIELEHCRLLPQTARELQLMLDSCMYARPKFNTQVRPR